LCLRSLIEVGGVDVDKQDENGWTLLRTAAWSGQAHCVQVLVDAGVAVNKVDADRRTALRAACWAGHLQSVKILLEAGASLNQVSPPTY
jgi:ankyrin repeat protein